VAVARSKEGLIYTTLLVVNVAIIALVVAWFAGWIPRSTAAESGHLSYGDALPAFTAKDTNGNSVKLLPDAGAYHLLFLIDPNHKPNAEEKYRLDYLNILLDRYAGRGLKALAILAGDARAASEYGLTINLRFPIVPDPDRSLSRQLTVHDQGVGLLLVDGQGAIRYAEFHEFPPRDILRQVVEKYIVDRVQTKLPEVKSPLLTPGRKLPAVMVRDVRSGETMILGPETLGNHTSVFFTADCSSCQFTRYLGWLMDFKLEESVKGYAVMALVTSGFYRDEEVDSQIFSWDTPLLLIEDPFEGLEDGYNTRRDKFARPIVVKFGGDGAILSVEPFLATSRTGE
jgi:peroxiredoxin Q/BCP